MEKIGRLDIIIGPMMSGKTVELLRRLTICAEIGLKVLCIKSSLDTRSPNISTHHPFLIPKNHENIDMVSLKSLKGIRKESYDVIGIDEAQFFDNYLFEFCKVHVETYKKDVIVAGLDANYKREKFGHILDLVPIADSIIKLSPFCHDCGPKRRKALFSYRITEGTSEDDEIIIGGKDKYKPLCRECYLSN